MEENKHPVEIFKRFPLRNNMISKIRYYWKRSKYNTKWSVFLKDQNIDSQYKKLHTPPNTWAADPFLFAKDERIFLFYELFDERQNIGKIGCSEYRNGKFINSKIIIEEPYHLSFPCVFQVQDNIYMIPETGSQKKVFLYECIAFPYKWCRKKTLLEDILSSDSIVYQAGGEWYLLASILQGNACNAYNQLYCIDTKTWDLLPCGKVSECSEYGIRNAGNLFVDDDGEIYRPGQNGVGMDYGQSLVFWKANVSIRDEYCESFVKEATLTEFGFTQGDGIHTYNKLDQLQVIDVKSLCTNSLLMRIQLMFKEIVSFIYSKTGRKKDE